MPETRSCKVRDLVIMGLHVQRTWIGRYRRMSEESDSSRTTTYCNHSIQFLQQVLRHSTHTIDIAAKVVRMLQVRLHDIEETHFPSHVRLHSTPQIRVPEITGSFRTSEFQLWGGHEGPHALWGSLKHSQSRPKWKLPLWN